MEEPLLIEVLAQRRDVGEAFTAFSQHSLLHAEMYVRMHANQQCTKDEINWQSSCISIKLRKKKRCTRASAILIFQHSTETTLYYVSVNPGSHTKKESMS